MQGHVDTPDTAKIDRNLIASERTTTLATALVMLTLAISSLALLGWAFNNLLLAQIDPAYIPMAQSTAISFTLLSLVYLACFRIDLSRMEAMIAMVPCLVVVSVAVIVLLDFYLPAEIDIESWLYYQPAMMEGVPIGRMSPLTALSFTFLSLGAIGLLTENAFGTRVQRGAAYLATGAESISLVVLLGYLQGTPLLYGGTTIPMALPTGTAFALLSAAVILMTGREHWPLRSFYGDSVSAKLMRSFIPFTVIVVVFSFTYDLVIFPLTEDHVLATSVGTVASLIVVTMLISRIVGEVGGRIDAAIKERAAAQSALKESEARFRQIYEQSPIPIAVFNENGALIAANSKTLEMFGVADESFVIGFSLFDDPNIPLDKRDSIRAGESLHLRSEFDFDKVIENNLYPTERSGKIFWEIYVSPMRGQEDEIVGYLGQILDITEHIKADQEKAKLQDQLVQSQKMESVGRLAGGVAHDFNNMLSVIKGHAELALQELSTKDEAYVDLLEIKKAADRSADITRQLLTFARKQNIAPRLIDLNDGISGMTKMLQRLISEEIDLAIHPGDDLWTVKIDPSQLDQIMANLVVNARDAISGPGKISIETRNIVVDAEYAAAYPKFTPGDYVVLTISDSGRGMDHEVLSHVFEPFFTTKREGEGTGLGLATVYGIVKQNSGYIHIYSEPGQGTSVKIYLPRVLESAVELQRGELDEIPLGSMETILLVEDETGLLEVTKRMLEKLNYHVLTASTPEEAIEIARHHGQTPDMLLTDVVMPHMNGKELHDELVRSRPTLRCLYISGYTANVITHGHVLEEGVFFLAKPFSMHELAAKVREVLDSDGKAREERVPES